LEQITDQLLSGIRQTSLPEFIAVILGIASVMYSRKENILVYPVGMISTGIFIFLYVKHGLYADASVNLYYTVMSIQGWIMWAKKRPGNLSDQPSTVSHSPGKAALKITASSPRDWRNALLFFAVCWGMLYLLLSRFTDSTVPVADSFTSGAAFTGMWLMNKKKLDNWTWWIITDLASVPLNFYKHLVFTSFQYLVFLVLAVMGYISWRKKIGYAPA
jgi:nicotinamide mononucleotide transporter